MLPSATQPGAGPDPQQRQHTLLVKQVRAEATDIISIMFVDPQGGELPEWLPGAHLDITLPSGLVRQYSLCGDHTDRHSYTVAVLREAQGRGGSMQLHDTALVGRTLQVRGPRNHFELQPAPAYLFFAGGIGITPILSMIREVQRRGAPWQLYYGGRDREHMAFVEQLRELDAGQVRVLPQDRYGLLDLAGAISAAPADAVVYACGPEPLLRAAEEACGQATPARALRVERFGVDPGRVETAGQIGVGAPFDVELRQTGVVLHVPADRTLLSVVLEKVDSVAYSCEEGYCGSCETRVLEGIPDHRDIILSPEEQAEGDTMIICVGRSKSAKLVLDL